MRVRHFLFLQGATSLFFNALGSRLRASGHFTARINFNVGDALFWRGGNAAHYRYTVSDFLPFLQDFIQKHHITDVVMHGDTRPEHASALQLVKQLGLIAHIWEEGYFRPAWLTLERGGINGNSKLPKNAQWYQDVAAHVPAEITCQKVNNSVPILAAWDIAYHLPNLLNPILYPGYKTNRPAISGVEFYGWALRFSKMPYYTQRDKRQIEDMLISKQPFFLLPLQLDGDAQLVHHSAFDSVGAAILEVLTNFAHHAPPDVKLVIKNHPLDTGLNDYAGTVQHYTKTLDIESRIVYLESGDLNGLLEHALGVVTVNSTVGAAALAAGCPVMALGEAIYDVDGLTFQGTLDGFWHDAHKPDAGLYQDFRRVVIHTTQVNGGFYTKKGNLLAVENAMRFLEPEQSPLEGFL